MIDIKLLSISLAPILMVIFALMHKNIVMLLASSAVIVFAYGDYRCKNRDFKDPLEKQIGIGKLDGWSISHFLLFTVAGYLFPDKYVIALAIGCVWELFEHYSGKSHPSWLEGYGDCDKLASDKSDNGNWWYGKWTDIVMNTMGFTAGIYLKRKKAFTCF